MEEMKI